MLEILHSPRTYYKWKESYDSFGLDGLKPHYKKMAPGMRKIMKENEDNEE
jgi:hypothetical protein